MPRAANGFTLIELLIVVVIIGILAAFAVADLAHAKEKSYLAQMKADLHNLMTAEEAFYFDSSTYTPSFVALNRYTPTMGITVVVNEATPRGWSATASHLQTAKRCYVYSGGASPVGSASVEGLITCS
ncbi:MAG TPA: prepilin-type N-terminal cleavage/methylation domain-containing protein [Gemmatimonadales bacterium]